MLVGQGLSAAVEQQAGRVEHMPLSRRGAAGFSRSGIQKCGSSSVLRSLTVQRTSV